MKALDAMTSYQRRLFLASSSEGHFDDHAVDLRLGA